MASKLYPYQHHFDRYKWKDRHPCFKGFSANVNGSNNYFVVYGSKLFNFKIEVYDHWEIDFSNQ